MYTNIHRRTNNASLACSAVDSKIGWEQCEKMIKGWEERVWVCGVGKMLALVCKNANRKE